MNLVRKRIILCLLDCVPQAANEIANQVGEPLAVIEGNLTELISENVCEKVNQNEASQYIVRRDVEPFALLVQVFLSNKEEAIREKGQFVTSKYYLTRIDYELVDYVLERFRLNSVYQTDGDKEGLRRILLASPSALFFALYGDTANFGELLSSWGQLDALDSTRDWFTQILRSQFMTPLLEKLIADMKIPADGSLYAKLRLRVAEVTIQVGLATPHGKYVEAVGGGGFSLSKAVENLRAGQVVSRLNPMSFSDDGLAFLHLGELQTALDSFDKALAGVQNAREKAIVLNNKGLAFLTFKQYGVLCPTPDLVYSKI